MVAPAYASARSNLARRMGLGRKRDEAEMAMPGTADVVDMPEADAVMTTEPARKRGRPRAAKAA